MPEQQQDEKQGQHTQNSVLITKKPTSIPERTKKPKRHRRRHNKYPSSSAIPQAVETVDTNMSSEALFATQEISKTSVATADWDVETDPAIPAISKKMTINETAVPTTPPIVEEVDTLEVGELHKEGQGRPQGDAPPIQRESLRNWYLYRRGVPLRAPLLAKHTIFRVNPVYIWSSLHLSWRKALAYTLFALLLTNIVLLGLDLTATHVYINTLDTKTGTLRAQQDIGGYRDAIRLTAPVALNTSSASAMLGVYTPGLEGTQRLLTLHNTTASSLSLQHSTALVNGAIAQAAHDRLLIESPKGMQVTTQDGQIAWSIQGQQPTHGVHPFTPTSDNDSVYSIASVTHSQIAAYTLADGHVRWTQTLSDTLEYAPPFVVDNATLYIASDHNVFALNTSDGRVRWEKPFASRTLLVENEGQQHLLLVLSSQGIQALQADLGGVAWSFRGDPAVSTLPTQFYQGTMGHVSDTSSSMLYATGVVWHMPSVREDVWLYAIDATTGKMRWSQQIASGSIGVDAGRVLQPFFDRDNSMVIVQRAIQQNENAVTAYDARTGTLRWNTPIINMNTSSPGVFQLSQQTFAIFTTTTHSQTILWTPSFYRTTLLLMLLVSILGLLLLLFLPPEQGRRRIMRVGTDVSRPSRILIGEKDVIMLFNKLAEMRLRRGLNSLRPRSTSSAEAGHNELRSLQSDYLVKQQNRSQSGAIYTRWRYAYTVSALAIMCVCIGVSIFSYIHSTEPTRQLLASDAQGSVVATDIGNSLHQLEAFKTDGTRQWTLFSSEGTFSIPKVQTQVRTLLIALHGDTAHIYSVAGDDPAYSRPLDKMLALYLVDRSTGQIHWQQVVSYPDEQQTTEIIGADATYIYVTGKHVLAQSTQLDAKSANIPQLFAVNKLTGTVDWRIFGPTQIGNQQGSPSTLLFKNGQVYWHVGDTIFTIDINVGQIIARSDKHL